MPAREHVTDGEFRRLGEGSRRGAGVPIPARCLAALSMTALLALACGRAEPPSGPAPAAGTGEPKRGGIAVVAHRNEPPGAWEPMRSGTVNLAQVSAPITGDGNLLKPCRDDVNQVCPGLAESWEANSNATEYTLKIREGVRWHDGKAFTAEDAKFWLDLVHFGYQAGDKKRGPSPRLKPEGGDVKQVEVLTGNKLKVTLERPDPLFPPLMAHMGASNLSGTLWHPKHLFQPELEKGNMQVAP